MKKAIIGKKIGMTQLFAENGAVIPVTVIEAGPCAVTQIKNVEKDGYSAVQLGFSDQLERKVTKPLIGHFKAAGVSCKKHLKEFKLDSVADLQLGSVILADVFAEGEAVDVTGITKGRGYSGVIKRWGAHRLRMSHGTGPVHRQVGSMGANSSPSRVFKNKKMAGQYGHEQVTALNLKVVKVDAEKNILAIRGAVPSPKGGIVFIRDSVKA